MSAPVEGDVDVTGDQSLWAVCLATRATPRSVHDGVPGTPQDIIRRSTDGGLRWTTTSRLTPEQPTLSPVTDQIAWIAGIDGTVERTTDGGRTWRTVLRMTGAGELVVQNARTAAVVVAAGTNRASDRPRRTNLVSYRTTDGGAHWTPTVIRLSAG